jgi:glycosyltransferase involved in cell wall biosynthesis
VERPPRIVGLSNGDPWAPRTASGAAHFLFSALGRRLEVVARADVGLTAPQRAIIGAVTFRRDRDRWRHQFYYRWNLANHVRSRNSRARLAAVTEPFDLALQIFGLFQTRGAPYCMYLDNTVDLSTRQYEGWVPPDPERYLAWERRVYGNARHLFTMGRPAADSLTGFYGVPPERVTVVGGGANFDRLPDAVRAPTDPVVLFVGWEWARKGGDELLEAFRRVRRRVPSARLVIAGTDAPRPEPGVELLGYVRDRERLARQYSAARVFCLPSQFEPYGLVLLEAMAHGVPCVVTRAGGMPDIVLDGETGLVVEPGDTAALADALARLLEDEAYAAALGAASRRRVERELNWDAVAARMAPALEAAARLSPARAAGARAPAPGPGRSPAAGRAAGS